MRITKYILLLGAVLIVASSCEKIIDIDIPEGERKIVVNGLISPDNHVTINLSRSLSVLEENNFVFLETADVTLSESGTEVGKLSYLGSGFYTLPNYLPVAGSEYTLTVDYAGLQSVSAKAMIQNPIEFGPIDTTSIFDEWGGSSLEIDFSFIDPSETNYYAIGVNASHKVFNWETMTYDDSIVSYPAGFRFLESGDGLQGLLLEDGATTYFGDKVFFSDDLFNGKRFDVSLGMWKGFYGADTVNIEVFLEHVSEPYYYYAVSSGKYNQTNGNPFSEAVSVYTNIENGFGIFSAYSSFSRNLQLVFDIEF
jgi:hypothetical protein